MLVHLVSQHAVDALESRLLPLAFADALAQNAGHGLETLGLGVHPSLEMLGLGVHPGLETLSLGVHPGLETLSLGVHPGLETLGPSVHPCFETLYLNVDLVLKLLYLNVVLAALTMRLPHHGGSSQQDGHDYRDLAYDNCIHVAHLTYDQSFRILGSPVQRHLP